MKVIQIVGEIRKTVEVDSVGEIKGLYISKSIEIIMVDEEPSIPMIQEEIDLGNGVYLLP